MKNSEKIALYKIPRNPLLPHNRLISQLISWMVWSFLYRLVFMKE